MAKPESKPSAGEIALAKARAVLDEAGFDAGLILVTWVDPATGETMVEEARVGNDYALEMIAKVFVEDGCSFADEAKSWDGKRRRKADDGGETS